MTRQVEPSLAPSATGEPRAAAEGVASEAAARRLQLEVSSYLNLLKIGRNLAPNSLAAYRRDLATLVTSLAEQGVESWDSLSQAELGRFLTEQGEQGLGARSLARRVSAVRGFLRHLAEEGRVAEELGRDLPRARLGRRLPRAVGLDDITALLRGPDLATARGRRDRALLSLTYAAGLRASEVVNLTRGDIDWERGVVSALGKGNKRRLVPLGLLALGDLRAHLEGRDAKAETRGPWLFPGARGRPLSRQAFWKIIKGYGLRVGLRVPIHPHVLRHSFASHLVQGGADLRSVQALLGHESITTTEIYTHLTNEHVRQAFEKSHPRA